MRKVDLDACKLALAMARADPELRTAVENRLKKDEQEAGLFAAAICQIKNLRLRPWECAPIDASDGPPCDRYGSRPAEIELRQRMKRANISIYHPDPLQALGAVERAA
jgi:hypothetical protein